MVRRLVEHEDVRFLQHEFAEEQPRRLTTRKSLSLLQTLFAAEEHLAENPRMSSFAAFGSKLCSHSAAVVPFGMEASVVLREVADLRLVSPLHRPGIDDRSCWPHQAWSPRAAP